MFVPVKLVWIKKRQNKKMVRIIKVRKILTTQTISSRGDEGAEVNNSKRQFKRTVRGGSNGAQDGGRARPKLRGATLVKNFQFL